MKVPTCHAERLHSGDGDTVCRSDSEQLDQHHPHVSTVQPALH
jgi:hypothetical protein